MDLTFAAGHWLKNQIFGKGPQRLHSPFAFDFYNNVIAHPYTFYDFVAIEDQRISLLGNQRWLEFENPGAINGTTRIKISSLAAKSLMPPWQAQLIFRLSHWLKAKQILELGTCLGITTAYLAKSTQGNVATFEAVQPLSEEASLIWQKLNIRNINSISGKIEKQLPQFLAINHPIIDLAIVDADHRKEATLLNYMRLLPFCHNETCLVFHDIYWSKEMAEAWQIIRARPEVTLSLDIYYMGFIFFRKESVKEHIIISLW